MKGDGDGTMGSNGEHHVLESDAAAISVHLNTIVTVENGTFNPPWKKEDFQACLESSTGQAMILLAKGRLAGYLFAQTVADETQINKICVSVEYRGKGFGEMLLRKFIARQNGDRHDYFLEVDSGNIPAVNLYRKTGFTVIRVRKAVYESGADALEMVLEKKGW